MNAAAPGTPCWLELVTRDRDKAVTFYSALFGWTTTEPEEEFGGYSQFLNDGRPIAGLMPSVDDMAGPPTWAVYLATPDAEKAAALAAEHGGTVVVPPMPIPGAGTMVFVIDAAGVGHGGWQAAEFSGTQSADQPGDPVWFEAYSTRFDVTRDFLRDVFGWEPTMASDTDEFRYATNGPEEGATAGLMDASVFGEGFAPHWTAYIKVTDMDATLAQVVELGGEVTQGPDDTPYGVLATIVDPNGQALKVIVPPAS